MNYYKTNLELQKLYNESGNKVVKPNKNNNHYDTILQRKLRNLREEKTITNSQAILIAQWYYRLKVKFNASTALQKIVNYLNLTL